MEAATRTVLPPIEEQVAGSVLRPGHPDYDDTRRIFNGMVDHRPEVIVRCTGVADVIAAVAHARENGLPLSVHGGGHGVTGHAVCEAGVMIDMRPMCGVRVDPGEMTVDVQGGANWGQVDRETQVFGLAVTGGRVPDTGVAGLALGSGSGWIERKCGLTCDNLVSADVVLATGEVVTASETSHPDLFWALRGGGGNFGVVTSFRFRLHEVGPLLLGGMLVWPHARAAEILAAFRDFIEGAPDEVNAAAALITAPPEEFVPEPARGQPVIALVVSYTGPIQDGERALAPLRALEPAVDMVGPMPYIVLQQLLSAGNPKGRRNYWTADFLSGLPEEAIDTLARHTGAPASPFTQVVVIPGGGAIARVPDDAMAFGHRSAPYNVHYLGVWEGEANDERNIAWIKGLAGEMKPYTTGGLYLNFIGDEGIDRVAAAFGAEKYARLRAIKDRYDPQNLFRLNQNIPPTNWDGARGA
jgi:FAD/FMN-containing dehydrogenase